MILETGRTVGGQKHSPEVGIQGQHCHDQAERRTQMQGIVVFICKTVTLQGREINTSYQNDLEHTSSNK